ncbi:MAG: hypothetical protein Q8P81_00140 [Nanoarchaeota archaeon]|nr:hypothetical protein [Nanoarchaeota archaeon]
MKKRVHCRSLAFRKERKRAHTVRSLSLIKGKRGHDVLSFSPIKGKRGSHIGIVLSFVIFITSVIFIYAIIQPAVKRNDNQNLIESVKTNIIKESSANLTTGSIFITEESEDCVQLTQFFTKTGTSKKIVAKTISGEVINIGSVNEQPAHLRAQVGEELLFTFYASDEFEEITPLGLACNEKEFSLNALRTERIIFEKKILELIQEYKTNYTGLRETLGMSGANGFGFEFIYNNGTQIVTEERNVPKISIYTRDFPTEYLEDKDTSKKAGILRVKIW